MFIGPAADQRLGYRHFMGMTAVFTAPPQFTVLAGPQEIGRTDTMLLTEKTHGPRVLLLSGRSWKVTWTDWKRRRCYVEPAEAAAKRAGSPWHLKGKLRTRALHAKCCLG